MGNFIESILEPLTGRKPNVPDLPAIDPNRVQAEAIAANQQALPAAQQLGTGINEFNTAQRLAQLTKMLNFAGGPGALSSIQQNIGSRVRGEIPTDVAQAIRRNSAAGALQGGFGGGSPLGRNLTARDFGLTSLNIAQQGMADALNFAGMADTPNFDVTSMFMSPQQRMAVALNERDVQFNRSWLEEQIEAAPSPLGQFIQNVVYAVAGTAGRYVGVAGGGGGGGAASSSAGGTAGSGLGG